MTKCPILHPGSRVSTQGEGQALQHSQRELEFSGSDIAHGNGGGVTAAAMADGAVGLGW